MPDPTTPVVQQPTVQTPAPTITTPDPVVQQPVPTITTPAPTITTPAPIIKPKPRPAACLLVLNKSITDTRTITINSNDPIYVTKDQRSIAVDTADTLTITINDIDPNENILKTTAVTLTDIEDYAYNSPTEPPYLMAFQKVPEPAAPTIITNE